MRRLVCFMGLFFFFMAFPLYGSEEELKLPSGKFIDDFDEFVETFSSKKCMECHEDIFEEWQESYHARSMVSSIKGISNFFTVGVPKEWEKKLDRVEIMKCLDCHLPQIKFATERLTKEIANLMIQAKRAKEIKDDSRLKEAVNRLSKLNITCYGCHNIAVYRAAPSWFGEPDPDTIYTANQEVESDAHSTEYSPTLKRAAFCAQCHGIYVAPDGESIMCNTLSQSYYHNYISMGGRKTCQECHMYAKGRGHRFPGGHDSSIVKEGLKLHAEILGFRYGVGKWVPAVNVEATLFNKAGHRVPDG
ncbi:cytochrome c family protein [Dissulfuribacter thermophilus]|uniref:Cytochrome c family protein n=2 Tax=Dissulfuribacter thermophilus TaxID=1156395 RepID=A0A1B9F6V1_9BACT|nr:cytochrome c family protein [Dissulfuribacter thermophilus]